MRSRLSQDDIENLLIICGTEPTVWNAHGNMQVCCPVHSEKNPSMGVSSEKQVCHCFSCGFAGDFPWLLYNSQPDQFSSYSSAVEFIQNTYHVRFEIKDTAHDILRYEETSHKGYIFEDNILPLYKLAPFKSGKETYKYFFKRGFTQEDMREYMIGRDLVNRTVTIPVFSEKEELLGVIGRFIDRHRKKNERYKIYDNFKRGNYLFPLNKFKSDGTIILVEGQLDAIRLHSLGFKNTLAKMGVALTRQQAKWITNHCDRVIDISDNDRRGAEGREKDKKILGNSVLFATVEFPEYGKDVCDWSEEDIEEMIYNAKSIRNGSIARYG